MIEQKFTQLLAIRRNQETLKEEEAVVKKEIADILKSEGRTAEENEIGLFTISQRGTKKYRSEGVTLAENSLKSAKEVAESLGEFDVKETEVLTFKPAG